MSINSSWVVGLSAGRTGLVRFDRIKLMGAIDSAMEAPVLASNSAFKRYNSG